MCKGVTKGLAGEKLSGSPKNQGTNKQTIVTLNTSVTAPIRSFLEKYGVNGILSEI